MEDDEHYVDDPKNPQFQHHGGEYAYQGGNSGGDFEGEGFQGEHEGFEASGTVHQPCTYITVCDVHAGLGATLYANPSHPFLPSGLLTILCVTCAIVCQTSVRAVLWCQSNAWVFHEGYENWSDLTRPHCSWQFERMWLHPECRHSLQHLPALQMHAASLCRQHSLEARSKRRQANCTIPRDRASEFDFKLHIESLVDPADGDIYGSEGQYIRYEEGNWDEAYDEQYQDVSSGQPSANPRGRSGSARPAQSYDADRYSGDNMAGPDAAYITPETTAPLQAAGQVCLHTPPHQHRTSSAMLSITCFI